MCWLSAHKGEHVWAHSSKSERERQIECRVLLGAPSIFAGAPNTWSEKPVILLAYFFKKKCETLSVPPAFWLLLPHLNRFRLLLTHLIGVSICHHCCREEEVAAKRFFFFFSHHFCREEELAVKRLSWGALRRFLWRATPPSTVEGALSPSTVEVSAVTMSFSSLLSELGWSARVVCWSVSGDERVTVQLHP